jgi:hypothetical protein
MAVCSLLTENLSVQVTHMNTVMSCDKQQNIIGGFMKNILYIQVQG